jgi:hypothetical protein
MADIINSILKFIGSKWFVLCLMIGMGLALPTTYSNLMVVLDKGQLASFWYIGLVFLCNVLAVLMAFWKFMGLINKPKDSQPASQQAW